MPNLSCNLTKQIVLPTGERRFCPAVESANGRVKANVVWVDGKEELHPEGSYYIEWREGSKRRRQSVGKDHLKAHASKLRQEARLNARARGIDIPSDEPGTRAPTIAEASTAYLATIKISRPPGTYAAYALTLQNFADSCSKVRLDQITRSDLIEFTRYLREDLKLTDRTAHNRRSHLLTFLREYGIEKLLKRKDKIKFVKSEPEAYEDEQLEKFFAACDDEERVFFEFLLMTGFRKKEAAFVAWRDVDLKNGLARVTAKPEHSFWPKDYEEREVPIPDRLIESLKAWSKSRNGSELIFPTRNGTPRKHRTQLLDACKAVAKRAKLNPDDFWLHKFRATFATRHLQGGVDLRTVQQWLGHSDLESTMRYLKPSRSQQVRAKVNAIFS
jgi:integrase